MKSRIKEKTASKKIKKKEGGTEKGGGGRWERCGSGKKGEERRRGKMRGEEKGIEKEKKKC